MNYDLILSSGQPALYRIFVIAGALAGGFLVWHRSLIWPLKKWERVAIVMAAGYGAMLGSMLPSLFAGGWVGDMFTQFENEPPIFAILMGPKTVVGGLFFSFVFVAALKRFFKIEYDTSDDFALPSVLIMGLGRWGCVFQHCCFGSITSAFWGIDLGDGHSRHPVQLLEAGAMTCLIFVFMWMERRNVFVRRRLFLFFFIYGILRFLLEFLREPVARNIGVFGFYQWLALLVCGVGLFQIIKRAPIRSSKV